MLAGSMHCLAFISNMAACLCLEGPVLVPEDSLLKMKLLLVKLYCKSWSLLSDFAATQVGVIVNGRSANIGLMVA